MESIRLSGGTIDYEDSGGDGPVIVFSVGLLMDATLWHGVVDQLAPAHRCIVPILPLGGHRRAMDATANRSLHGLADLLGEFLERLDLHDVTLVAIDWGGPQLTAARHPERLAALVLLSEEAFDNIPPGLPGAIAALATRVPGGIFLVAQSLRPRFAQRLPFTFGRMAKRPIPPEVMSSWTKGIRIDRGVRNDVIAYVRTSDTAGLQEAAIGLANFDRPTLILWATEDRIMPLEHGRRLASIIPNAELIEIDDAYTLLPLDQPDKVARHLAEFVEKIKLIPRPE